MVSRLHLAPDAFQGEPIWTFATVSGERLPDWDWGLGEPCPNELGPVRHVKSGSLSRHVPVHGYCSTTRSTLGLESGLELELMLWLDRQPAVRWIVPQPVELRWAKNAWHVPDLLSVDPDGLVTVWDVKGEEHRRRWPYQERRGIASVRLSR